MEACDTGLRHLFATIAELCAPRRATKADQGAPAATQSLSRQRTTSTRGTAAVRDEAVRRAASHVHVRLGPHEAALALGVVRADYNQFAQA